MIRDIKMVVMDNEQFISYCSESDFDYTIYINQRCKIIINNIVTIGTLTELCNEREFAITKDDGHIMYIRYSDIDDIYSEEEIGLDYQKSNGNENAFLPGSVGQGMSFHTKYELLQQFSNKDNITMQDPKNEF